MDASLVALLGTPGPVGFDSAWPVAMYDAHLACTYMAEVRHGPGEVQATCQVLDDAPPRLRNTVEHICSIRAVNEGRGWVLVGALCCDREVFDRQGLVQACAFFRALVRCIQDGVAPDHVALFNAHFQDTA